MARPITPPPMTACVKSACLGVLEERCLEFDVIDLNCGVVRERMRNEGMMEIGESTSESAQRATEQTSTSKQDEAEPDRSGR